MLETYEDTYDRDCDEKAFESERQWKISEEHFLSVSEGDE